MNHQRNKNNGSTPSFIWLTLFLLAVGTITAQKHHHLHHRKKMVHKNVLHVMALQRLGPQPRTVEVLDKLQLSSTELLQPPQTVLHRCDEIACCAFRQGKNMRCLATEEPVTLYFRASDFNTGKTRIIAEEFRNHTKCSCRKHDDGP